MFIAWSESVLYWNGYWERYFLITELRLAVRSSLVKVNSGPHEHEYGPESYDEESDTYSVSCDCGHVRTYEKMWKIISTNLIYLWEIKGLTWPSWIRSFKSINFFWMRKDWSKNWVEWNYFSRFEFNLCIIIHVLY